MSSNNDRVPISRMKNEPPDDYDRVLPGDERIEELPPSCKLVWTMLGYEGPLTQDGVAELTTLSGRTARYALKRLDEAGVLDTWTNPADARQKVYALEEEASADV